MFFRKMIFWLIIGLSITNAWMQVFCARPESPYAELIGKPAPAWEVTDWIHSPPLTLQDLRGKVALVRWWTGSGCPYCMASAPILNDLYKRYKDEGLVVLGFYHHKSDEPLDVKEVQRLAKKMGMKFPLAIDPDWKTLRRYWMNRVPGEAWTSVSFLIDRKGIVRFIHPGGTITKDEALVLEKEIIQILEVIR